MNIIWKYLHKEQRSLLWLSEKYSLKYWRLYKMKDLSNEELAGKLTFQEVDTLEKEIPGIKTELRK